MAYQSSYLGYLRAVGVEVIEDDRVPPGEIHAVSVVENDRGETYMSAVRVHSIERSPVDGEEV